MQAVSFHKWAPNSSSWQELTPAKSNLLLSHSWTENSRKTLLLLIVLGWTSSLLLCGISVGQDWLGLKASSTVHICGCAAQIKEWKRVRRCHSYLLCTAFLVFAFCASIDVGLCVWGREGSLLCFFSRPYTVGAQSETNRSSGWSSAQHKQMACSLESVETNSKPWETCGLAPFV